MNLYLHVKSEHHPSQKQAALKMLIHWVRTICNVEGLDKEIDHLKRTFRQTGYSNIDVNCALVPKQRSLIQKEKPAGVAMIPFQQMVSNKISRLLTKHNIKTIHILVKNIHMLRPIKDKQGLKVAGIYCVPCECSKVYVGQTGTSIKTRCKEHLRYICLGQPEKFAMAEHVRGCRRPTAVLAVQEILTAEHVE
jgi:hypothetical protein